MTRAPHTFKNYNISLVGWKDQFFFFFVAGPKRMSAHDAMAFSVQHNEWMSHCVTADSLVSVWSWHLSSYSAALHFSKSAFCSGSRWSVCNFRAGPRPKSHDSCSSLLAPLNSPLLLLLAPVFRKWTRILGEKKKKALCDVTKVHDIFCRLETSPAVKCLFFQPFNCEPI